MRNKNTTTIVKPMVSIPLIAIGSVMVMSAILGMLVVNDIVSLELARIVVSIVLIVAVFIASWSCATCMKTKRLMFAGITCCLCSVTLLLLRSMLFAKCQVVFDYRMILTLAVFLPAGLLASKKRRRRR